MRVSKIFKLQFIASVLSMFLAPMAFADAGTILFAYGKVSIERQGQNLNAKRGFAIKAGDIVKTYTGSMAQIKLSDNSLIALKPNTSWNLKQYIYDKNNLSLGKQTSELVKGGLRAITGAVGKANPKNIEYAVGTATIGIRGTTFEAVNNLTGKNKGVFVRVETGAVNVDTGVKAQRVNPNEAVQILPNRQIKSIDASGEIFTPVNELVGTNKDSANYDGDDNDELFEIDDDFDDEDKFDYDDDDDNKFDKDDEDLQEKLEAKPVKKYNYMELKKGANNTYGNPTIDFEDEELERDNDQPKDFSYFQEKIASPPYEIDKEIKYNPHPASGEEIIFGKVFQQTVKLDDSGMSTVSIINGYELDASKVNINMNAVGSETYTYKNIQFINMYKLYPAVGYTAQYPVLQLSINFATKKITSAFFKYGIGNATTEIYTFESVKDSYVNSNGEFGVEFNEGAWEGKNFDSFSAHLTGNLLHKDFGVAMFAAEGKYTDNTNKEQNFRHIGYIEFKK